MPPADLQAIVRRLHDARHDLGRFMAVIGGLGGDWIEMRHTPANAELDGWRSREDFAGYMRREADFFPQTFESIGVDAICAVEGDCIAIDPLSLSGRLAGSDRHVNVRYRLTLHFSGDRLSKITGMLTPDNVRDDVIAWLKVIQRLGGLGQTLALTAPAAAATGARP